jgi:hypothetical protein
MNNQWFYCVIGFLLNSIYWVISFIFDRTKHKLIKLRKRSPDDVVDLETGTLDFSSEPHQYSARVPLVHFFQIDRKKLSRNSSSRRRCIDIHVRKNRDATFHFFRQNQRIQNLIDFLKHPNNVNRSHLFLSRPAQKKNVDLSGSHFIFDTETRL